MSVRDNIRTMLLFLAMAAPSLGLDLHGGDVTNVGSLYATNVCAQRYLGSDSNLTVILSPVAISNVARTQAIAIGIPLVASAVGQSKAYADSGLLAQRLLISDWTNLVLAAAKLYVDTGHRTSDVVLIGQSISNYVLATVVATTRNLPSQIVTNVANMVLSNLVSVAVAQAGYYSDAKDNVLSAKMQMWTNAAIVCAVALSKAYADLGYVSAVARLHQMTNGVIVEVQALTNAAHVDALSTLTQSMAYVDGAVRGITNLVSARNLDTSNQWNAALMVASNLYNTVLIADSNKWTSLKLTDDQASIKPQQIDDCCGILLNGSTMAGPGYYVLGSSGSCTSLILRIGIMTKPASRGWTPLTLTNTLNHLMVTTNSATVTQIITWTANNTNTWTTGGINWLTTTNGLPAGGADNVWFKMQYSAIGSGTGIITSLQYKFTN